MEAKRVQIAVRLSESGLCAIDALAEAEHRTRSAMIRVLLAEAVTARQKARR